MLGGIGVQGSGESAGAGRVSRSESRMVGVGFWGFWGFLGFLGFFGFRVSGFGFRV